MKSLEFEIGERISHLRKEAGVTQEELATVVGVSAQAVSKWENGGTPDIELLPKIADYFGVTVDSLFGRKASGAQQLQEALRGSFLSLPKEERVQAAFKLCGLVEQLLYGDQPLKTVEELNEELSLTSGKDAWHSRVIYDSGVSLMGLGPVRKYFFLMPEEEDKTALYFDGADPQSLFRDLSDPDVFNALLFLYRRNSSAAFSEDLFVKELAVDLKKAQEIAAVLKRYFFVHENVLETEGGMRQIYVLNDRPAFCGLLMFAAELCAAPRRFFCHRIERTKAYL